MTSGTRCTASPSPTWNTSSASWTRTSDGWPEGLGNVERSGMGEEKLDNAVYTIRGLYDLADMARSKGDVQTAAWALKRAEGMEQQVRGDRGGSGRREPPSTPISTSANPGNDEGLPEALDRGDPHGGRASQRHGNQSEPAQAWPAQEHGAGRPRRTGESAATRTDFGMYHTGTGPTVGRRRQPGPDLRHARSSEVPSERMIFTLNTAIMAVGEGNYGRLGEDQQQHYMYGNVDLQLTRPTSNPARCPRSRHRRTTDVPSTVRSTSGRWCCRRGGPYGTIWPVVHQWLGVRPDLGRGALEVVPQVPPDRRTISGENIRLGDGSVAVSANVTGDTYTTIVNPDVALRELVVGHTVPGDREIASVTLDGAPVEDYRVRRTNRGQGSPRRRRHRREPAHAGGRGAIEERDSALTKSLRP